MTQEVTSELRVYMRHIRRATICARGARDWWSDHGFDWNDFLKNGIAADVLRQTEDPLAARTIACAEAERDGR